MNVQCAVCLPKFGLKIPNRFGKNVRKPQGGFFCTHTVYSHANHVTQITSDSSRRCVVEVSLITAEGYFPPLKFVPDVYLQEVAAAAAVCRADRSQGTLGLTRCGSEFLQSDTPQYRQLLLSITALQWPQQQQPLYITHVKQVNLL